MKRRKKKERRCGGKASALRFDAHSSILRGKPCIRHYHGQRHHITICLRGAYPTLHPTHLPYTASRTITVWYGSPRLHPSRARPPHKVMDEYRRGRHRSIKFQALTGASCVPASPDRNKFFYSSVFRYLCKSSVLSIIPNKKEKKKKKKETEQKSRKEKGENSRETAAATSRRTRFVSNARRLLHVREPRIPCYVQQRSVNLGFYSHYRFTEFLLIRKT